MQEGSLYALYRSFSSLWMALPWTIGGMQEDLGRGEGGLQAASHVERFERMNG